MPANGFSRGGYFFALISALALHQAWSATVSAAESNRPNLVFILADDQCYETIAAWGDLPIETPNLDRLARRGTSFTHTYNMGSWTGAVCVASRTMLNTGRFLWHAHRVQGQLVEEQRAGRMWSEMLRRAGYRTYMTGKWHLATDATKLFDVTRHIRGGMPAQTPAGYDRPLPEVPDRWSPSDPRFGGYWQGGRHWSVVVADDAVDFVGQAAREEAPFFMYLAFNAPHDPRQSPQEFVDRYPREKVQIPPNFLAEYPFKDAIGCGASLRDEHLGPFPRTEYSVQVHRQEYYALITHLDQQIGRILDAIDESGKSDSTYIFFTADHGLAVGHHGFMGKQNLYDHSVRVPMIVAGPGIDEDRRIATPVYLQDVMPTTLELARIPCPEHVQFSSLLGLLRGDSPAPYDGIYGAYLNLQRMITLDGYKLILYPSIQRMRLYHLARDPAELIDLADDVAYRPVARRLFVRLMQLQAETADTLDLATPFADWMGTESKTTVVQDSSALKL